MTRLFPTARDLSLLRVDEILQASDDPTRMLRLMAVELEGTLVRARAVASHRLAERHHRQRRVADAEFRKVGWGERAEAALSPGREELARAALVEKQKAAADLSFAEAGGPQLDELIASSEAEIAKLQHLIRQVRVMQAQTIMSPAYH